MSSDDILIKASGLGKFYPHRLSNMRMLRYLVPWAQKAGPNDFWALRGMDFELRRGEVVGLIGCNGSGKSTFLRMAAGLLEPSEGSIDVRGTSAALLELGAGFNPEFTGRENIYLSGRIYGYSIEKIESIFSSIVEFADIGDHLEQPVKTYSSGMYARLAFAVAIQVNPEILLVDEILSVGDLGFQAKCFRRIEEIKKQGTSILFVSHDLNTMRMLCDRLILLENGRPIAEGEPKKVSTIYSERLTSRGQLKGKSSRSRSKDDEKAYIEDIRMVDGQDREVQHPLVGGTYYVKYRVFFRGRVKQPIVSLQFKTMVGLVASDLTSLFLQQKIDDVDMVDVLDVAFKWQCNFCPGPYRIGVGVAETTDSVPVPLCGEEAIAVEIVSDSPSYGITHVDPSLVVERSRAPADGGR